MVFDYMDHDMTGLMERLGYKFTVPQVSINDLNSFPTLQVTSLPS